MKRKTQKSNEYYLGYSNGSRDTQRTNDMIFYVVLAIIGLIFLGVSIFHSFSSKISYHIYKNECHNEFDSQATLEKEYCYKGCYLVGKEFYNVCYNKCNETYGNEYLAIEKQVCNKTEVDEMDYGIWFKEIDNTPTHIIIKKSDITKEWLISNCVPEPCINTSPQEICVDSAIKTIKHSNYFPNFICGDYEVEIK